MADPRNFIDKKQYPRLDELVVTRPTCFMRSAPRPTAAAGTELVFGTKFNVHRIGRGWLWGQSVSQVGWRTYPGYVGWVRQSHLGEASRANLRTIALSTPVFSQADIKSPVKFSLPLGSAFQGKLARAHKGFYEIEDGFVHSQHVDRIKSESHVKDWISIAEMMMGQPYIWGGISSFGLDCSGLVQTALRNFGHDAPRDSDQQAQMGKDVTGQKTRRGDLVFWKGHVGILQSATQILHANAHHMCVASEPLSEAVKRIKENAGPVTTVRRLSFD